MITAVDTNILLDILVANEHFYEASGDALEEAAGEGSIVISDTFMRSSASTSKHSGNAMHSLKAMKFVGKR